MRITDLLVPLLAALGLSQTALAQRPVPHFDEAPERRIALDQVQLETLRIDSNLQSWTLRKLCIDGQAYWAGFSETTPTALAIAYREGKPERCAPKR